MDRNEGHDLFFALSIDFIADAHNIGKELKQEKRFVAVLIVSHTFIMRRKLYEQNKD